MFILPQHTNEVSIIIAVVSSAVYLTGENPRVRPVWRDETIYILPATYVMERLVLIYGH